MGYIEPVEFSALGLLAVAFVSLSSPDDVERKLGYETLGEFKNVFEMCQKRKVASWEIDLGSRNYGSSDSGTFNF